MPKTSYLIILKLLKMEEIYEYIYVDTFVVIVVK